VGRHGACRQAVCPCMSVCVCMQADMRHGSWPRIAGEGRHVCVSSNFVKPKQHI
jgi:hypothetical protein